MAGTPEYVDWADVVVTGTIDDRDTSGFPFTSSTDPATYTVTVDQVHKGEALATPQVLSPASGASCGLENVDIGGRYVVFAAYENIDGEKSADLWSSLCGGTERASAPLVAAVAALTGPGRAPPEDEVRSVTPIVAVVGGTAFAGVLVVGSLAVLSLRRRRGGPTPLTDPADRPR